MKPSGRGEVGSLRPNWTALIDDGITRKRWGRETRAVQLSFLTAVPDYCGHVDKPPDKGSQMEMQPP